MIFFIHISRWKRNFEEILHILFLPGFSATLLKWFILVHMCVLKWSETTRDWEVTFSAGISLDYMIFTKATVIFLFLHGIKEDFRKLFYNFCYTGLTFGHNTVDPKLFDRCRDNMPNFLLGRKFKLLTLKRTFSLLTLKRTFFLGVPHSSVITSSF